MVVPVQPCPATYPIPFPGCGTPRSRWDKKRGSGPLCHALSPCPLLTTVDRHLFHLPPFAFSPFFYSIHFLSDRLLATSRKPQASYRREAGMLRSWVPTSTISTLCSRDHSGAPQVVALATPCPLASEPTLKSWPLKWPADGVESNFRSTLPAAT